MKEYLENSGYLVLHEIELSKRIVHNQKVCRELAPLQQWINEYLKNLENELNHNLYFLSIDVINTLPNIFKQIQIISRHLSFCNTRLIPAIYRYKASDNVCIKLLHWLHNQHIITKGKPFGVFDGQFMIAPSNNIPTIYYLPNSSQHILLHLPLFFHEIGHKFFSHHRLEMMDLVREFQANLLKFFKLPFQKNDKRYKSQLKKTKIIVVDTWVNWIEELYCDAVGVRIGGAGYIHAFSFYLRMSGRSAFFKTAKDLGGSSHPVSWLRIKFIVKWAEQYGLENEAKLLDEEWKSLAKMQGIKEQYFGFYKDDFYDCIKECLDDMLVESDPILFQNYDNNIKEFNPNKNNFIELTNLAWRKFHNNLKGYEEWEKDVVSTLINLNP